MRVNVIALVACASFIIASEANAMRNAQDVERCIAKCHENHKLNVDMIEGSYHNYGAYSEKRRNEMITSMGESTQECIEKCRQH